MRTPSIGQRVKLESYTGILVEYDEETGWALVQWDENKGPKFCKLSDLEIDE